MEKKSIFLVVVVLVVVFFSISSWAGDLPSFQGLGYLPGAYSAAYGVSRNGSVVVGTSGGQAFQWTKAGGIVGLGNLTGYTRSEAYAASDTLSGGPASVIVGSSEVDDPPPRQASRWVMGTRSGLGWLPGGEGGRSWARDVSADGSIVIGTSYRYQGGATNPEAFRWTVTSGMVGLGFLPGGYASFGSAVSANGMVTVGANWFGGTNLEATRWTSGGATIGLGDLSGGDSYGTALDVSDNGNTVVGESSSASYPQGEAFRWTPSDGMVGLGALPGATGSAAMAVSADGSVVVGDCVVGAGWQAFYWDATTGMVPLRDLLASRYGLDLTGWTLSSATGISSDSLTIVGSGINPDGYREAWISTVPEPASAVILGLGSLFFASRRRR